MASPVFKSQFFGPLKAKDDEEIEIKDGSSEVFSDLINFVYREEHFEKLSSVESTAVLKDVLQLFYLGEKYQIGHLQNYLHCTDCELCQWTSGRGFECFWE